MTCSKLKKSEIQWTNKICFETYFSFFGLVLISPRTIISEKSIRNLLSKVAILHQKNKMLYMIIILIISQVKQSCLVIKTTGLRNKKKKAS